MIILKEAGDTPLYLQVYEQLKRMIVSGEIGSNHKLPSKRQLAKDLSVSKNTVEVAYQQLLAEGYLKSKSRSGFFVEDFEPSIGLPGSPALAVKEEALDFGEDGMDCSYHFQYGKLDVAQFPFGLWSKITCGCLQAEKANFLTYGDPQGVYGLRSEIAKYLYQFRGVICTPEQIIIGAGTQYCLGVLAAILRNLSGPIAIEEPGYAGARAVFNNYGFDVLPIGLEEDGINIDRLAESGAGAVYVTPAHQFPVGVIMPIGARMRLIEWAQKRDGLIIEDDYCHLRYKSKPIPALQGLCNTGNVVYLSTFSKILAPSLRLSYMVLPPQLLEDYRSSFKDYNSAVPFLTQKSLEMFMKAGHWERHVRRMSQNYKKKHDLLIQSLLKQMGDKITIYGQNAGLHLMIKVHSGLSEQELIVKAANAGVMVYPASSHWARKEGYENNMVLLGYTSIALADIERGVELLCKAWLS